jgi:hypothetical protein
MFTSIAVIWIKKNLFITFPNIYEKCLRMGIDVMQQMIPVAPAAHYSCGGIKTDEWGRTSIQNSMPAANVPVLGFMAQTVWQVTVCWKQWCSDTGVILTAENGSIRYHLKKEFRTGMQQVPRNQARDDPDHAEPERTAADHERLCGYRTNRYPFGKGYEKTGSFVYGNSSLISLNKSITTAM